MPIFVDTKISERYDTQNDRQKIQQNDIFLD